MGIPARDQFFETRWAEVRRSETADFPLGDEFGEPPRSLDVVGERVIPPMELNEIEAFDPETREGGLDGFVDIGLFQGRKNRPIGNVFRVNLDGRRVPVGPLHFPQHGSEEFLHSQIDVGAVKRAETRIDQPKKAAYGSVFIGSFGSVSVRKLPEPVDDSTHRIPGRQFAAFGHEPLPVPPASPGNGTRVTSPCRKVLRLVRAIRNRPPQFGSGQAITVSVVIQSLGAVSRCLAGSRGESPPRGRAGNSGL